MERSVPPTDTLTTADARQERVVQVAEETILTPLADFPRIDLRSEVEPWDKRRRTIRIFERTGANAIGLRGSETLTPLLRKLGSVIRLNAEERRAVLALS